MSGYTPTNIILHTNIGGDPESYEATISVDDEFVVQVSGNTEEATFHGITDPEVMRHGSYDEQENAYENLDSNEIEKSLELWGLENNLTWLTENADDTF